MIEVDLLSFPMLNTVALFDIIEGLLYAGGALFATLLCALSFSAYRDIHLKKLLYAVVAFSFL